MLKGAIKRSERQERFNVNLKHLRLIIVYGNNSKTEGGSDPVEIITFVLLCLHIKCICAMCNVKYEPNSVQ